MVRPLVSAMLVFSLATSASAEIKTKELEYQDNGTPLTGFLTWDDAIKGPRAGIIVVHEWWGLNDYVRERTKMLAKLGYVAFAADMYGTGKVTEHGDQASAWAKQIRENVQQWQQRAQRALDVLRGQKNVDPKRIAAIGYCFGGATVLELAYSGADLAGVVSFHGSLPIPSESQGRKIKASILAANGSEDKFVPLERREQFQKALDRAGADWQMVIYGGARHGFTNPNAAKYGIENIQYNENADKRSWKLMQTFFEEIFKNPGSSATGHTGGQGME